MVDVLLVHVPCIFGAGHAVANELALLAADADKYFNLNQNWISHRRSKPSFSNRVYALWTLD